jgi:putative ABC transport system ATP-binding protein
LKDLGRSVNGRSIVSGVSATVRAGEILAVVGPSGSGKSSLLRLVNRLDEPTEGTVYLDDIDYRTLPPSEVRRRVGIVMQRPLLFPGTVRTNVAAGPGFRAVPMEALAVEELLQAVGLPGFSERDVAKLSGGEVQRVALARTLANRPEALLLDEPTSALDEEAERAIEALLLRIVSEFGPACVLVTHELKQAARLASHVMTLEDGRVCGLE